MNNRGFSAIDVLIVLVVIGIIAASGYWISHSSHKTTPTVAKSSVSTNTPTSTSSAYSTLSPATVESKAPECNTPISYASSGAPGPVQCSNGGLNVTDWQALAALEPQVLSLGYNASASQVQSALCSDVKANISNPIELSVYQIAALYYGWNFNPSPASVLTNGSCQNTDD